MIRASCDIAIVGCGLGGIIAAIGIRKAGHRVTVFEQALALTEVSRLIFETAAPVLMNVPYHVDWCWNSDSL